MRKHFLILMLMALLPLAGFAAVDISTGYEVTISGTGAMVYDGNDYATRTDAKKIALIVKKADASTPLTGGTDYVLKFYLADGETTTEHVVNAGDYWVSAVAKEGTEFEGETQKISFHISKKTLTYTLKEGTGENEINFTRAYKSADFASKKFSAANVSLTGAVEGDVVANLFTFANDNGTTATWKYTGSNANFNYDASEPLTTGDHGYVVTLEGLTPTERLTANYDYSYTSNYVKIKQLQISSVTQDWTPTAENIATATAGKFYASPNPTENYTYNGAKQVPSYTLYYVYNNGTANAVETVSENAGITYTYKKDGSAITDPFDADETNAYEVYIGALANTNYVSAADVQMGEFSIDRASLTISVNPKTKEYWGAAWTAGDATYSNPVLLGRDNGKTIIDRSLTVVTAGGLQKDVLYNGELVAGYVVKAKVDAAKIVMDPNDPSKDVLLTNNYNVITPNSNWTVTPKALTFSISASNVAYPNKPNTTEITWDVTGIVTQPGAEYPEAVKVCFEPKFDNTVIADETAVTAKGTYNDAIKIQLKSGLSGEQEAMLKNYSYDLTAATAKCNLTITGANFIIVPAIDDVEYGTPIDEQYLAYTTTAEVATVNPDLVEILYKEEGSTAEFTAAVPTAVGTYLAKVQEDVEGLGTGNFEDGEYTTEVITFTISPKTLKPIVANKTLHFGDASSKLQTGSVTYEDGFAPLTGETPEYIYSITANMVDVATAAEDVERIVDWHEGVVLDAADTKNAILCVSLKEGVTINGNYKIAPTYTKGNLTLLNTHVLELDPATDMAAAIQDAANNSNNYDVEFAAMPMAANEWRAMVLPFEVTTVELVKKLGVYVVVNKFKGASYDTKNPTKVNVNFGIEMNKIEAGVPFLIKPAANINWNTDANALDITFADKTIVGAPIAQGQGAETPTADKATFTGTYKKGEILWWGHGLDGTTTNPLKSKWLCYDGATRYATGDPTTTDGTYQTTSTKSENTWKEPEGRPHLLSPMEAYVILDADATESRIFVEDFENGTTVIKELGVDGTSKAYSVDGWYTLNGIKLQGVPTEKGIYINNGKKVVIK